MALNKRFNDIQKLYDKLGWDNADTLKNAMGKSPDYMYIAFLTQTDTDAPVENVLYNDFILDSPIYFSYEGLGTYRMHCNLFKPGYMEVEIYDGQGNTFVDSTITATVYTGYVELKVFNFGTLSDNILQNTPIKIKVWSNASVLETQPPAAVLGIFVAPFTIDTGTSDFGNSSSGFLATQNSAPFYLSTSGSAYDTGLGMRTGITDLSIDTGAMIEVNGPSCAPNTSGYLWVTDYNFPTNWEVTDNATLTNVGLSFTFAGNDLSTANYEAVYTYNPGSVLNDIQVYAPSGGGCAAGILMGGYGLGLVGPFLNDPQVEHMITGFGGRDCTFSLTDNGTSVTIRINNCVKVFAPSTMYLNDTAILGAYTSVNFVEV